MDGRENLERDYRTQEVFTPDWMVNLMLDEVQISNVVDCNNVYLDRAVGDGQFLSRILVLRVEHQLHNGTDIHQAFVKSLDSLFGVDIEPTNIKICRERLLCDCTDESVIALVHRRILVGDCLQPNKRLLHQTDNDHFLMKKYFSINTLDSSNE